MGIKLEFILFLANCIITIGTVMLKLDDTVTVKIKAKKELEFKKTTFIEVDQKKHQSHAFVEKGMRKQGVLY